MCLADLQTFKQDVSGAVWSSKLLFEDPEVIYKAHLAFLESGADLVLTGTSVPVSRARSLSAVVRLSMCLLLTSAIYPLAGTRPTLKASSHLATTAPLPRRRCGSPSSSRSAHATPGSPLRPLLPAAGGRLPSGSRSGRTARFCSTARSSAVRPSEAPPGLRYCELTMRLRAISLSRQVPGRAEDGRLPDRLPQAPAAHLQLTHPFD
jgi:hypothetical protein